MDMRDGDMQVNGLWRSGLSLKPTNGTSAPVMALPSFTQSGIWRPLYTTAGDTRGPSVNYWARTWPMRGVMEATVRTPRVRTQSERDSCHGVPPQMLVQQGTHDRRHGVPHRGN